MNLDLKPYYKDYKCLLFYEELDGVKFSLCDQYSTIPVNIIVLTIYNIPSYLYNKINKNKLAFRLLTNQIRIHYLQSILILHFSEFGFVTFKVPRQHVTDL